MTKTALTQRLHKAFLRRLPRPRVLAEASVQFGPRSFRAPVVDGSFCDVSEPWMIGLLAALLPQRQGTFIDVGMNVGQTLLAAKAVDRRRAYVGFEPNPQCFAYCERLVRLNALPAVTLVPAAVGTRSQIARLQLYGDNGTDPAASLVQGFRPGEPVLGEKLVPVFSYAEVAATLGLEGLGLVKIDVEGAESDVLTAMEPALATDRPWIVIEILPCYRPDNTDRLTRQKNIEELLQRLDYRILRVRKNAAGAFAGIEPIDEIGIHADLSKCDYVLCPRADEAALIQASAGSTRS